MPKYIKYFPKPFLDDLVEGRCVPFIGAGFSKNAKLPHGKFMPLWDDLGKKLAADILDYDYSGAIDALSAFEHEYSRPKLVERLHDALNIDSAQPGDVHRSFCSLPFDLCVTTNFEFLLEKGYELVSRYCRPIIDEDQLSIDSKGPEVKLLKFHGDLHHPNRLIATEQDYDVFLDKYPLLATYLGNLLIVKTAFFIGYSLDDPDFRHIWQLIGERLGKLRRQAYTVSISAPPANVARFERRGVKVINIPGKTSDFALILSDVFDELNEYWSDKLIETSTSTDDESLAELVLPKREINRLCFFSVPSRLYAFYKTFVFPLVERHGFAPLLAMDVVSPGDNISAKIAALIDRSSIVVVDISSPSTAVELQLALAKKQENNIVVITEEELRIPSDIENLGYIVRPKEDSSKKGQFLNAIDNWFGNRSQTLNEELSLEPVRLLEKKEYRAAVVSAVALFENHFRTITQTNDSTIRYRPIPTRQLFKKAIEMERLTPNEADMLLQLLNIRNEVVHLGGKVNGRTAKSLVNLVMKIINRNR